MGIELITLLIVVALLALMALGVPLGITTLTVSLATAILYFGERAGFFIVAANVGEVLHKYELIAVPFFVFMANVLERSGIAQSLFDSMAILGGRFRGSVAVQTCVVAVVLAAMSGIMGGEIVMLGLIALPQMLRLGYDRKLSIGIICSRPVCTYVSNARAARGPSGIVRSLPRRPWMRTVAGGAKPTSPLFSATTSLTRMPVAYSTSKRARSL